MVAGSAVATNTSAIKYQPSFYIFSVQFRSPRLAYVLFNGRCSDRLRPSSKSITTMRFVFISDFRSHLPESRYDLFNGLIERDVGMSEGHVSITHGLVNDA